MQIIQNQQEGKGYEFSFRRDYGARRFVHVPAESLAVFRRNGAAAKTDLALVLEHHAALCEIAIERSRTELITVVEITEADAKAVLVITQDLKREPRMASGDSQSSRSHPPYLASL